MIIVWTNYVSKIPTLNWEKQEEFVNKNPPLNHWNIENYSYISILALPQYDQIFIDKQLSFVSLGQKYIKFLSYDQFTSEKRVQPNQKIN